MQRTLKMIIGDKVDTKVVYTSTKLSTKFDIKDKTL